MSPRRAYRRPSSTPPLDPPTFVRRLASKVGTDDGRHLVARAFDLIEHGASPDPWIQEVRRARDAGEISVGLARFLIYRFGASALTAVVYTDPVLVAIMDKIEQIRTDHGLRDDEDWLVGEGPPEWEALSRRWDVAADALMDVVFHRNGETDLVAAEVHKGDPLFDEGRRLVFGEEADTVEEEDLYAE